MPGLPGSHDGAGGKGCFMKSDDLCSIYSIIIRMLYK